MLGGGGGLGDRGGGQDEGGEGGGVSRSGGGGGAGGQVLRALVMGHVSEKEAENELKGMYLCMYISLIRQRKHLMHLYVCI